MKIQNLAVIFIIIILPISLILTSYVQNQVKTLGLQVSYDTKLNNATYDALKAFQLNTFNSDSSDLSNSKMRDVEASANTFFTSIASNFNMEGYNKDVLKDYVPALVYTMYDGYYIYSPYTNTLSNNEQKDDATYSNGEKIYGLKPYVYYSCRYIKSDIDVVITYTLDNYITIQGKYKDINGYIKYINKSGYLLSNIIPKNEGKDISYRGIKILRENLREYVKESKYPYVKRNGVKYYEKNGNWYSNLNNEEYKLNVSYSSINDESGINYYMDAFRFSNWVKSSPLGQLKTSDAVYEDGTKTDENEKTIAEKLGWRRRKNF